MPSTMANLSFHSPLYSCNEAGEAQILSLLQPAVTVTVSQCHKYWQSPATLNGTSILAVYVLVAYEFNYSKSVCEMDKVMWLELDITCNIHTRHDLFSIRLHLRPCEVKVHFMVISKCLILTRSCTRSRRTSVLERKATQSFWMLCTVHTVSARINSFHALRF